MSSKVSNEYNREGRHAGCLEGGWWEDRVLLKEGQPTRVFGKATFLVDSFERVMPNCRNPPPAFAAKNWETQQHQVMAQIHQPSSRPTPAPRGSTTQEKLKQEAVEYVNSLRAPAVVADGTSETHRQYVRYDEDAYKTVRAGSTSSRTQSQFTFDESSDAVLAAHAAATVKAAHTAAATAQPAPPVRAEQVADVEGYANGYYGSDPAVTLYTARLPEAGAFSGLTAARVAGIPLGKAATFTNPPSAAYQAHAMAHDKGPAVWTGEGTAFRTALGPAPMRLLAPGAELALAMLFGKLLKRFDDEKVDVDIFLSSIAAHAIIDTHVDMAALAGNRWRGGGNGGGVIQEVIPVNRVRSFLQAMKLRIADTDIESILAACDVDGTGRVSLGAFHHYINVARGNAKV